MIEKLVAARGTWRTLGGSREGPRGRPERTGILLGWVGGDSGTGLLRSLWLEVLSCAQPPPAFFYGFSAFFVVVAPPPLWGSFLRRGRAINEFGSVYWVRSDEQ